MNLYCKIYADSELEKPTFIEHVRSLVGGDVELRTVHGPVFDVDVSTNDAFDEHERRKGADQFLYYRYILDIEPHNGVLTPEYTSAIGDLLERLWGSSVRAVAACDFEEKLPGRGGLAELNDI